MRRMLIAGALALAAGGQAWAADLPPAAAPPPRAPAAYIPAPPVYNWGGLYIGINGGGAFGNSNWTATGGTTGNFNLDGFLVGGTLGANFQFGAFVVGVEGDGDWSTVQGSTTCFTGFAAGFTCKTSSEWLATLRGRAGYAIDRVLVYGTAGGAAANIDANLSGFGTTNNTEFGWTAGGGIEFAITPNWTAKVEYLFVDLANGSCSSPCTTAGAPSSVAVKFDESVVRAG